MTEQSKRNAAAATMARINDAWVHGHVDDLAPMLHPEIVMVFPGFAGRIQGWDAFLAGFRDFYQGARVHAFRQQDQQVDVVGDTAVVSFRYEMLYERSGERFHCTGRDVWVFEHQNGTWKAVWRTMLDMDEKAA